MLGFSIGMMIGGLLFPPDVAEADQPQPSGLQIMSSQYGTPIPVLYGQRRIPGNLIWYGNFRAVKVEIEAGKGMGGQEAGFYYLYSCSFALGLCMGEADVLKCWANNKEVDSNKYTVYTGTQIAADAHMSAKLTALGKRVPVWKNLCYVVFDNYSLGQSPTLPNFTFEVSRVVTEDVVTLWTSQQQQASVATTYGVAPLGEFLVVSGCWTRTATGEYVIRTYDRATGAFLYGIKTSDAIFYAWTLVRAENSIYVMHMKYVGGLWKDYMSEYDPRSNSIVRSMQLPAYCYYSRCCGWDEKNHKFWFYAYNWPSASTFTEVDTDGLGTTHYVSGGGGANLNYDYYDVTGDADYLWAAYGGGMVGSRICRHRKRDAYITHGPVQPVSFYTSGLCYDEANEVLLQATSSGLAELNPKTFAQLDSIGFGGYSYCPAKFTFGYDEDNPRRSQYAAMITSWGNVLRLNVVDVKDFSLVEMVTPWPSMTFNPGALCLQGSLIYVAAMGTAAAPTAYYQIVGAFLLKVYGVDDNPARVTYDVLTNALYGAGLDASYLNSAVFADTQSYCDINDLLVSFYFDRQMTFIDFIQCVLQHHDGFFSYYNGQLAHRQNKVEASVVSYTKDDVKRGNEQFPVSITKQGREGYANHIIVEYTRRNNEYYTGTAKADDMPDIDRYGRKPETLQLAGICKHSRAQRMAHMTLRKGMQQPETISLPLRPSARGISPGQVFDYTDADLELSSKKFRAVNVSEMEDGGIRLDAVEVLEYYDTAIDPEFDDESTPSPAPGISDPASAVTHVVLEEWPAMYSQGEPKLSIYFSAPDEVQWAGAYGYRSYTSGGTFDLVDKQFSSGITGVVTAVGILAGKPYITITLDTEDTLSSAVSLDALLQTPFQNLFILQGAYGTVYCRFATCTLLSAKVWRLTDLLIDLTGFTQLTSSLSVIATDLVAVYNDKRRVNLTVADLYRTLYFKLASMNFAGDLQDLADCTEYDVAIIGKDKKPIQGLNLLVNGQPEVAGAHNVSEGDLLFTWMSVNRFASGCSTASVTGEEDADFQEWCIEIWDVGLTTLVNSYQSLTNSWTYTSAAQAADGGLTNFVMKLSKRGGSTVSSQTSHTVNIFA